MQLIGSVRSVGDGRNFDGGPGTECGRRGVGWTGQVCEGVWVSGQGERATDGFGEGVPGECVEEFDSTQHRVGS